MNTYARYYWDLLIELAKKEVKIRYKNSYFGYLWSIANPLALALVFFFAIKLVVKIPQENYALFLICGLFPWQWFQNSITVSSVTFISNASLIKKVYFPRELLISAMVLSDMVHFLVSIPIILLFVIIYGKSPALIWIPCLPLIILAQLLMTHGVSLMVSTINLFFRDLERLIGVLLTLLFYCTPVIYPETLIPARYQPYMNFNPVAKLVVCYRELFLHNTFDVSSWLMAFGYGVAMFLAGYIIYSRLRWRFAELV